MKPEVIYENTDIVVIAKPAGVLVHPDISHKDGTISDWFAEKYPASRGVGEPQTFTNGTILQRPGIVHRLDAETSGALVLAKTQDAHVFLKNAFQNHEVRKTYLAFVYGTLKEKKGTIDFPIGRSRKDFRLRSAQPKARGTLRDAVTDYEVLGEDETGEHTALFAYPKTGRTHQIRVHLKAIHHPIVCDPLYAPNHACDLGFNRLGLHAYQIDVPLLSGKREVFTAPVPQDLAAALPLFCGTDTLEIAKP